ncbi:MAG: metallophosphoesterase family protein [Anaerolineaceae bacterium]|nr:metallophosphoesterase family protein [Anaerolineaceae bacterium]
MKIALIGDIHANLPALEAVLAHIKTIKVKQIWNIGDIVGFNAFPNEVIELLRRNKVISISGNFERNTLRAKKMERTLSKDELKQYTFRWTYKQLTKENRRYLKELPREIRYIFYGKRILITHASPVSKKEHLNLNTPNERLESIATHPETNADVIIVGHSHDPFVRKVANTWFINTGSVGRSDDGDQRACYATLEINANTVEVIHYRIPYDIDKAIQALKENNLPPEYANMLIAGRGLTGHAKYLQKIQNTGNSKKS